MQQRAFSLPAQRKVGDGRLARAFGHQVERPAHAAAGRRARDDRIGAAKHLHGLQVGQGEEAVALRQPRQAVVQDGLVEHAEAAVLFTQPGR